MKAPYVFSTIPAENITVYAKWELAEYEISYNLDGGTNNKANPGTYTIESGEIIFAAPSKLGYEFVGWFTDADCKNAITSLPAGSYGDIEIFAKWNIIEYEIEFIMPDGAEHENPLTYTVETDVTELLNAILKGYTFDGWYLDADYAEAVTTFGGGSVGNITLYAKFTANTYDVWMDGSDAATATVSFDLNGASGTAPAAQIITETNTLVYPEIPTRSGYVFGGWYINKECKGSPYDFSGLVGGDITLYAKWVKVGPAAGGININDSVTFNLKGTAEKRYIFVPLASGNISITATGSVDTLGSLYKDGKLLRQDDDSAADGKNFLIVYNVTAGEVYEIRVRGFSANTNGSITLSISGTYEVAEGGYAQAGNKVAVTYGSDFTLPVPEGGELQKFLGWQDENGVMYTDETGASIRVWDKDSSATLFSKWERMEYTITFETSGGSPIDSVTLEYGARVDINQYVTTRTGYTFAGWYLDGEEYNASTMPDHNITLTARWKTFALGSIKYDADKKAISVDDEITAELFGALCIDTNGMPASFTVSVDGVQEAGNTITVRLTAASGGKTKVVTITDIKVYGMPNVTVENAEKDYICPDEFTAEAWGASGTDTFGENTDVIVRVGDDAIPGTTVTVYIDFIDKAGNVVTRMIEGVKYYAYPVIEYNEDKVAVSEYDDITAELFDATASDSFGESLTVTVTIEKGKVEAGQTITVKLSAEDSLGNLTEIELELSVYGDPIISKPVVSEMKESQELTPQLFGITAMDTFQNELDVEINVLEGEKKAGHIIYLQAVATDAAGNTSIRNFEVKVYGAPTIDSNLSGVSTSMRIVSFNLMGGKGNIGSQILNDSVTKLVYPEIPYKEGYAFRGWYTSEDCTMLFDFSAPVMSDTMVYAGWMQMVTEDYYRRDYIDIASNYNSKENAYEFSTKGTTSGNCIYSYFTAFAGGEYTVYYSVDGSSSSDNACFYIYNATQGKVILSNSYVSRTTTYKKVSFTAEAGDVIYIRNYLYRGWPKVSLYVESENPIITAQPTNNLDIEAYDSFGNRLQYTLSVKSGSLTEGGHIVYTITVTDHLGNTTSITTASLGVYSVSGIRFDYSAMASDVIKVTSRGEEFFAEATDSFGNKCRIYVEAAEGYVLEGGETINLFLVAQDVAGNILRSELIKNIKVYDAPIIQIRDEYKDLIISETDNIDFIFTAFDSFGEELSLDVQADAELVGGTKVNITVTATDDAGNTSTITVTFNVLSETEPCYAELYVDGVLWQEEYLLGTAGSSIPVPESQDQDKLFYGWMGEDKVYYTDSTGKITKQLNTVNKLYAVFYNKDYTIIKTFSDLQKISMNGKYVLVNDIVMNSSLSWKPLGTEEAPFTGIFDGNGFVIKNLKITKAQKYMGLFGYSSGTIMNLVMENVAIDLTYPGLSYTGALIGYMAGGEVSNCSVTGSLKVLTSGYDTGYDCYVGGLIGYATGTVNASFSLANVSSGGTNNTATYFYGNGYAGGLIGIANACTINGCYARGTVTVSSGKDGTVGGLIATVLDNSSLSKCYFDGEVIAYSSRNESTAGGLIGTMSSSTVEQCTVTGRVKVTGKFTTCGGLIGGFSKGTVSNCYTIVNVEGGGSTGGLVGSVGTDGRIVNCYATGNVSGSASYTSYAGGLVGVMSGREIINCYATGAVSAYTTYSGSDYVIDTSAGGLIGKNNISNTNSYYNSYYNSTVVSKSDSSKYYPQYCSDGTEEELNIINSEIFIYYTLEWDRDIWIYAEGQNPILTWQLATVI